MNSLLEILISLNKFEEGVIDAEWAASIICGNIQGFNTFETSNLFKILKHIQSSLEDFEFVGGDHLILENIKEVRSELEFILTKETKKIDIMKHFNPCEVDSFFYKENICDGNKTLEILKVLSEENIFICWRNQRNSLMGFKKFNSLSDLDDFVFNFL